MREARGELDEAERLFRANLARLDAEAQQSQAAATAGGLGGPPLSSDAVEALLFLASHCKVRHSSLRQSSPTDAELKFTARVFPLRRR